MPKLFNKFKILSILLACYLQAIFLGKAKKSNFQPKKILIIQTASLGDMVCATPIFKALKNKYPDCYLTVMGNKPNQELLANNSDVDQYLLLDIKNNFWQQVKQIKKENFDFACLIFPDFYALALLFLSHIKSICGPQIIGYSPYNTKAYQTLLPLVIKKPHHVREYASKQYLKMLEPLNIFSSDTTKHLYYSEEALKNINSFFISNDILAKDLTVCLVPTAGNKIKEWPSEKFAKIIEYLKNKYQAKIILTATPNEQEYIEKIFKHLTNKNEIYNFIGNINELKALISQIKLYISVDTGPIYIAEAFNIPTIDILGPVDEHDQPPISPRNLVVHAPRIISETYVMNSRKYNKQEAQRQVNDITIEMVQEKIDELINKIK